ncbi:MAG: hypothetical protein MI919_07350, partial [Holophagales bacterium]|nr:hypothetical protein [Holophagales bacterium]
IAPDRVERMLGVSPAAEEVAVADSECTGFHCARNWVEELDGQIGVDSCPRVGSCFWIEIPVTTSRKEWSSESSVAELSDSDMAQLAELREAFTRRLQAERRRRARRSSRASRLLAFPKSRAW